MEWQAELPLPAGLWHILVNTVPPLGSGRSRLAPTLKKQRVWATGRGWVCWGGWEQGREGRPRPVPCSQTYSPCLDRASPPVTVNVFSGYPDQGGSVSENDGGFPICRQIIDS